MRMKVPSNERELLDLKKNVDFLHKAHELLNEKRDYLLIKLKEEIFDAKPIRKKVNEELKKAFTALAKANMDMGIDDVEEIALTAEPKLKFELKEQSIMSIVIPSISIIEEKELLPDYGLFLISHHLDEAVREFLKVLKDLVYLSGLESAIYRIANEIKKTQRRINALEHVLIPDHHETIAYLEDQLEEYERDEITTIKIVKEYLESKSGW
ncbi:MAG: V-type ATP synthase subunit D [Candidatus Helarchaeota archaeon]